MRQLGYFSAALAGVIWVLAALPANAQSFLACSAAQQQTILDA